VNAHSVFEKKHQVVQSTPVTKKSFYPQIYADERRLRPKKSNQGFCVCVYLRESASSADE
jgi:hypothetical protein